MEWPQAYAEVTSLLKECLSQLEFTKHRKQAELETYLRNNMVLMEI